MTTTATTTRFYGWRVVSAAFVLAIFDWGLGFYGPPVYLHAEKEARGWSLGLVSTAVTVHFLAGAVVVANLPWLYRRFGLPRITKAGALTLGIIAPWFVRSRPAALAMAYNGASLIREGTVPRLCRRPRRAQRHTCI